MHPFLKLMNKRVVVLDGAMGTMLESLLPPVDREFPGLMETLALTSPELVRQVHDAYLDAGADGVETNTFSANRFKLAEHGAAHLTATINQQAALIARQACDAASKRDGRPRFVVGSMGPTGHLPSMPGTRNLPHDNTGKQPPGTTVTPEHHLIYAAYREQADALIAGGVDVLLVETGQDLLEMSIAVRAAREAAQVVVAAPYAQGQGPNVRIPIIAQGTINQDGRMLLGTELSALAVVMEKAGADVIGLNCGLGPVEMEKAIGELTTVAERPVSCLPNAGLPENIDGRALYGLQPDQFAQTVVALVTKWGIRLTGGCCGTTPDHIRELVTLLKRHHQPIYPRPNRRHSSAMVSSLLKAVPLSSETARPTIVGERLNAHGSKAARTRMVDYDWDGLVDMGASQVENGAAILDICAAVDSDSAAEAQRMASIVKALQGGGVSAPLMLDSTDPNVLEAGLGATYGKAIVNSVNLEDGGRSLDRGAALAKRYGAALVALCIDEKGMADTCERKLEVAHKLVDRLVGTHGFDPRDIAIDLLTFSLGTGDPKLAGAAAETLRAISRLKAELPQCPTILGVSNVSYGLPLAARRVMNRTFLELAVDAGLDMAIVNPAEMGQTNLDALPDSVREDARAAIQDGDGEAIFRLAEWAAQPRDSQPRAATGSAPAAAHAPTAPPSSFESRADASELAGGEDPAAKAGQNLARHIIRGQASGLEEALKAALSHYHSVPELLDRVLLPAMVEVGEKFAAGTTILPLVLRSADVMNRAVAMLQAGEPASGVGEGEGEGGGAGGGAVGVEHSASRQQRGTVVLATVQGDVHDIGKNLVGAIMRANGFRVVDLGKQVPAEAIVQAVRDEQAQIVGLSALLVSTSRQMAVVVGALHKAELDVPVLLGGAAVSPSFASSCHFGAQTGEAYPGGVFYCKDAFAGLEIARKLAGPGRSEAVEAVRLAAVQALAASVKKAALLPVASGASAVAEVKSHERNACTEACTCCGEQPGVASGAVGATVVVAGEVLADTVASSPAPAPVPGPAGSPLNRDRLTSALQPTRTTYLYPSIDELAEYYLDLSGMFKPGRALRAPATVSAIESRLLQSAQEELDAYKERMETLLKSASEEGLHWLQPMVAIRVVWCVPSQDGDHLQVYPIDAESSDLMEESSLAEWTIPMMLPVGRLGISGQSTHSDNSDHSDHPAQQSKSELLDKRIKSSRREIPNLCDLLSGKTMVFSEELLQDISGNSGRGGDAVVVGGGDGISSSGSRGDGDPAIDLANDSLTNHQPLPGKTPLSCPVTVAHSKAVAVESVAAEGQSCSYVPSQVALWIVTVGSGPATMIDRLTRKGMAEEALLVHLLAAEMTEALARFVSSLASIPGSGDSNSTTVRLSPGYAAWPDISAQNLLVHSLVDPDGKLGVKVSSSFQLIPEYSSTGILVQVNRRMQAPTNAPMHTNMHKHKP